MKKRSLFLALSACVLSLVLSGCSFVFTSDSGPVPALDKGEEYISESDAQKIVADHFSLELEKCRIEKSELDEGRFEIELFFEGKEYEAEVDARTGKLFDSDIEKEDKW